MFSYIIANIGWLYNDSYAYQMRGNVQHNSPIDSCDWIHCDQHGCRFSGAIFVLLLKLYWEEMKLNPLTRQGQQWMPCWFIASRCKMKWSHVRADGGVLDTNNQSIYRNKHKLQIFAHCFLGILMLFIFQSNTDEGPINHRI